MDHKEEIDNSALVVGLYNQDSCIPLANFLTINLLSGRTEHVRARALIPPCDAPIWRVGDVTATYIRKSEIPSCIYAKHQYRQESEYGSTWCIIRSNI